MKSIPKLFALGALTIAINGCVSNESSITAQPQQLPATTTQSSTPTLALEKYTLANGLEVVLHQDKSDPVVALAIQYHVGSNREKPGRTGFAHFFEHMLFQDSEHVGAGNFIKHIGNMGGVLNGGTWQDGTIYYEVVPNDGLEQVLWMESDRMGYFINTVTQQGLENEKQVVKNEKRQGVDNRPYGHTEYVTLKALYPEGHPYSWDVIGSLEDLQNATLKDVREFYQQWYGVNNATLVLAGDFESAQAKTWIEKYFGELQPRGDVTPLPPMPVSIKESVSLYHEDNFATLPELTLTFPTVEQYQADAYALDILAELLTEGKDSVLYKHLVEKDKIAPAVNANNSSAELAGRFTLTVRAFNDTPLDKVKVSIDNALQEFATQGFSEQQLKRLLTKRETAFYNQLTSVFNKASTIAQHNEFAGDPALVTKEIEHYRAVTRDDIMRVFKQYIFNKNYIATSFVPKGKQKLALTGAKKADVVEEKIVQGAEQQMAAQSEQQKLAPIAQAPSSFDRSVMPKTGTLNPISLPEVKATQFDNGLSVLSIEHTELPLVSFSIRVQGGHLLDPANKNGVANLLTSIMMEGTKDKTPQQLEEALGAIGATLNFTANDEFITLSGSTLAKNYSQAMALAQEILLQPRWDESEWQRIKQESKASIQQANANPGNIAQKVYAKLMYGDNTKLGSPVTGNINDVDNISLTDVKAYYQQNIVANLTTVHVAGDISEDQVLASVTQLKQELPKSSVTLPAASQLPQVEKAQVYFVDVPGAKQSFIRIGNPAMVANAKDYYPAVAVNHNLGGSFSGQLFQILRLQKGYTYGAYSGFSRENSGGVFSARSSVRSNVTLESLQTFREILTNYGKDFDQQALTNTKSVLRKSNSRAFETTGSLLGVLQNISSYNLANNYVEQQQQQLEQLTLAQAQATIAKYINPDKMVYLVVGDANTQLPRIKALGLGEPIILDRNGNKI
ncbi:peptidase M16 [Thalassotalea insulae]|uniref:Peptidase M16 n=1 Tax=Thalassotalea insulae TaxID=2056778 RepID=A0ABQ6GQR3_9GAMM|nr:pitrilysin family protein [Thalassotalea insulae]GLX77752.1 peptidase M16 [Thalassotalea insulae]